MPKSIGWLALTLLLAFPAPLPAQGLGAEGADLEIVAAQPVSVATLGTTSEVAHVVHSLSFLPPFNTTVFNINVSSTNGISVTSAAASQWWAEVRLPAGALVTRIELEACDTFAGAAIAFGMARGAAPAGAAANITSVGNTGATPAVRLLSAELDRTGHDRQSEQQLLAVRALRRGGHDE